jgi:ferredoxin-thioredoxin reductase catalytic subunit
MDQGSDLEEVKGKLQKFAVSYAAKKGYSVNPDGMKFDQLLEEMAKNRIEFGKPYCPCMTKRISGDEGADRKLICPCIWHESDIEEKGHCFCDLFFKK